VVRKLFGLRREKIIVYWKKFPTEDLRDLTPYQILCGLSNEVGWMGRECGTHGGEEIRTQGFDWETRSFL
jgi:hypothetical protein